MVKQFKGEVKISDVQNEFDALLDRINKMVDAYNGTNQVVTNIDYTKGGSNLAPSGYTLTVGGIKQALKSLDGHVVGGKCFYNTATTVKMSDGLLFTKGGVFRLPDSILDRPSNGNSIWYDTNAQKYVWGQKRISGKQSLLEDGATSIVSSGDGYKNSFYEDVDGLGQPTGTFEEEKIGYHSLSTSYGNPNTTLKQSGVSVVQDVGGVGSEGSERQFLKSVKWENFDLKKFPHKSIPLESTTVEFNIMRSGVLTEDETSWSYSGSDNSYAILGYYQDETFTPYICLSARWDGGTSPYLPHGATPNINNISLYPSSTLANGDIPLDKDGAITTSGGMPTGDLYYCEKYGIAAWGTNGSSYITDNINKPKGIDTGKHIVSGVKFKLYHPSPYANTTEKAALNTLKGKLVCQMDAIDKDGTIVKYWDRYDSSNMFETGIMSHPLFVELWTANQTDGELGSSREKYMAENSPLGKCNMILYGTSDTLDNDIVFKQSEYNPTFNVTTGSYEVWDAQGKPDPDCYHITDYATARDSDYRNDLKNLQVQDLDGTFKITVKNRLKNNIAYPEQSETIDTSSKAKFVCAGDVVRFEGQQAAGVNLLGTQVSWNAFPGHRKLCYWYPCNYLYLPKGVESPYTETDGQPSLMCQFPFEVNIEKEIR
nr:MAG TPA: hypothetical protein [Caudoviricetes sp.]